MSFILFCNVFWWVHLQQELVGILRLGRDATVWFHPYLCQIPQSLASSYNNLMAWTFDSV